MLTAACLQGLTTEDDKSVTQQLVFARRGASLSTSLLAAILDMNGTESTGTDSTERLVVAEMRHHDTELLGGVEYRCPGWDGYGLVVDC